MKDITRPPGLQAVDDDVDDEEDPNLYGEEPLNFVHDQENDINVTTFEKTSSPVVHELPRIKPEPEDIIIKREQSPTQLFDDGNIPLPAEDESNATPSIEVEDGLQTTIPRKRQRLIPEVLLYTWKDLQKRRQKDLEQIKKMNNPMVKKPKNIEFSLNSLYDRLKPAGLDPPKITLEKEICDQPVSRAFMSSVYGGGSQDTFPIIGQAKYAEHGMRHFMYVNASLHTQAPQMPGNPGLFYNSELHLYDEGEQEIVHKTFVRIDAAKWMYVGDYTLYYVPPLSKEEWKDMAANVRNAWVSFIMKKGWATNFRARVVARREVGRKPTRLEWYRVCEQGRANQVTPEEIHAALEAGHEQLGISGMKCSRYDEAFQRQLIERFSRWTPPAPRPKGQRRGRQEGNDVKPESDSESKPKIKQEIKAEESESKPLIKQEIKAESKLSKKFRKRKREAMPEPDAELSPESEDPDVLQDVHFKKKLRRKPVVQKQEDDERFGPSDNDSEDSGDWKPEMEPFGGSQVQMQAQPAPTKDQQQRSGTQVDPIIL